MLNFHRVENSQIFTKHLTNEKQRITFAASKCYGAWLQC